MPIDIYELQEGSDTVLLFGIAYARKQQHWLFVQTLKTAYLWFPDN